MMIHTRHRCQMQAWRVWRLGSWREFLNLCLGSCPGDCCPERSAWSCPHWSYGSTQLCSAQKEKRSTWDTEEHLDMYLKVLVPASSGTQLTLFFLCTSSGGRYWCSCLFFTCVASIFIPSFSMLMMFACLYTAENVKSHWLLVRIVALFVYLNVCALSHAPSNMVWGLENVSMRYHLLVNFNTGLCLQCVKDTVNVPLRPGAINHSLWLFVTAHGSPSCRSCWCVTNVRLQKWKQEAVKYKSVLFPSFSTKHDLEEELNPFI